MKTFVRKIPDVKPEMKRYVSERGWGNGYVIVPKGHKLHGVSGYDLDVRVHGGITLSVSAGEISWPEIPENLKDGWIFGFDTAHYKDNLENCPKEYVEAETQKLKKQLSEL